MSVIPAVSVLLYQPQANGQQALLFKKQGNELTPASTRYSGAGHISESAARVLGRENYSTLVQTVQQYKNGVTKLEDSKTRNVLFLAPCPPEGQGPGQLRIPEDCEWIPLDDVAASVRAHMNREPAPNAHRFSSEFLKSAPLLLGKDRDSNILQQIKEEGRACGVVRGNPGKPDSISCDLRDAGNDPQRATVDEEFLPQINVKNNTFTVEGQTYEISFKKNGKIVPLAKMDQAIRTQLLHTLREAVRQAAPADQLAAIENITLNFTELKLSGIQFYGNDPDNPVHSLTAEDETISSMKDRINETYTKLEMEITRLRAQKSTGIPVRGIPAVQNSCLGAALHLISHLYGDDLETRDFDRAQKPLAHHLSKLKRKILKEENGSVNPQDMDRLIELLPFDMNDLEEPHDYLVEISQFLGLGDPDSDINIFPPLGNKETRSVLEEMNLQFGQDETPATLNIHIPRETRGSKNFGEMDIPKQMTLENGMSYELVAAAVHHGDYLDSGHYISIIQKNDQIVKCNDKQISLLEEADLASELKAHATHLVYRRVDANPDLEKLIHPLHSHSKVDTDKWLGEKIILDYAEKVADSLNSPNIQNGAKVMKNLRGGVCKIGNDSELSQLVSAAVNAPERYLVIPTHKNGKHWTMLIVDKVQGRVEYFDSVGRPAGEDVIDFCNQMGLTFFQVLDKDTKWQDDGWRCGYYILQYLQLRVNNTPEEIQEREDLRAQNIDNVTSFRGMLQNTYNRYRPNYGFN